MGVTTLSDTRGARRYRKLRDSECNLLQQIAERLESVAIMQHERAELEPAYLRSLVDRPDLGELKREGWC